MIDKYAKLIETLKATILVKTMPILSAEVTKVSGETCEVKIGNLTLTDIRLKATINGKADKLLLLPKVGSMVLIGSLTGDLKDLAVLKIDELEKIAYKQGSLTIEIDSVTGKVKLDNDSTTLLDLFQQLSDLLKQFKVTTPSGPSTAVLPDTMQQIMDFETGFKQLLN